MKLSDFWIDEFLYDGGSYHCCGLCANHGVIDTRGIRTPAGSKSGRALVLHLPEWASVEAGGRGFASRLGSFERREPMIDLDQHPAILPPGYRLRTRFALLPIEVAGRRRWLQSVRIVQRLNQCYYYPEQYADHQDNRNWATVGFWEEIMPTLGKAPADPAWSE